MDTLYLGGNYVRIVCERVWRKLKMCAIQRSLATRSQDWQVAKMVHMCEACRGSWKVMTTGVLQDKTSSLARYYRIKLLSLPFYLPLFWLFLFSTSYYKFDIFFFILCIVFSHKKCYFSLSFNLFFIFCLIFLFLLHQFFRLMNFCVN